jgi:hypothetical protein
MSPEFDKLLQWGGTPVALCGCGRTHYVASGDSMEPGELARFEEKRRRSPQHYIPDVENDSVGITEWFGETLVWNCPCRRLEHFEAKLWANRERIIQYFKDRSMRELNEATANLASISGLPASKP